MHRVPGGYLVCTGVILHGLISGQVFGQLWWAREVTMVLQCHLVYLWFGRKTAPASLHSATTPANPHGGI